MEEKKSLLKRFNSLPTISKIFVIILILFVIMLIVSMIIYQSNQSETILSLSNFQENQDSINNNNSNSIIASDNFYGMRFNMTLSEFCSSYNKEIKSIYEDYTGTKLDSSNVMLLTENDFIKSNTRQEQSNLDFYVKTITLQDKYELSIVVYTEMNTENIVSATVMADYDSFINAEDFRTVIGNVVVPSVISGVRQDLTLNEITKFINSVESNGDIAYTYEDNMVYQVSVNSTSSTSDFTISAISKEKYNELYE